MGASPHLRGRERSSRKEAAAARDGRGSPSHQHTVPGRQLYFLLLSAGGRVAVTSKPFRGRGGGCRPPAYTKLESGRAWNKIPAFVCSISHLEAPATTISMLHRYVSDTAD